MIFESKHGTKTSQKGQQNQRADRIMIKIIECFFPTSMLKPQEILWFI